MGSNVMTKQLVSIIIPIYNVRQYILDGINIICEQSYPEIEILLIDDGSTDGSGDVCDAVAKKYNHVRVFHKQNEGAGSARNMGIDNAKGDFIYFFDIDDKAYPELIDRCVKLMNEKDVDILTFGFNVKDVKYGKGNIDSVRFPDILIESNEVLKSYYLSEILFVPYGNGFPWNKFYRKSFLDKYHLRFEDQRIQQDEVFNLKCYQHLDRMYLSSEVLYLYYIYDKGNTRSCFIPDRFDIYVSVREQFEKLRKEWSLVDSRFDDYLQKRFYQSVDQTLRFNLFHPDCPWNKEEKRNEMCRVMNHPYTIESMTWAMNNTRGLENMLYLYAYRHQNIALLSVSSSLFAGLRALMHKLS